MNRVISTLLVVSDASSLFVIDQVFKSYATETKACVNLGQALQTLRQRKFDLLLLDVDLPWATEVLEVFRNDYRGYASIVIAVTESPLSVKERAAVCLSLVLQKPFTAASVEKTLRAAYPLIIEERRSKFRYSVHIPASAAILESGQKHSLPQPIIQDISYTGLRLRVDRTLTPDARILVDFQLPGSLEDIHVSGKVIWSDAHGQTGIQILYAPPQELKKLRAWLAAKCPLDMELMDEVRSQESGARS